MEPIYKFNNGRGAMLCNKCRNIITTGKQPKEVMCNKCKQENETNQILEIVKKYICPLATDQEIYLFLQLCKFQQLNPFLREIYLIKYSSGQPASMVTGKETFTKRANRNPQYKGFKAGVVVSNKQWR